MSAYTRAKSLAGRLACGACALALAACEPLSGDVPPCRPAMPSPAALLSDPAFATLKYRSRINYDASRGEGYDLRADAKFDYKAAVQVTFVPNPAGGPGAQFCAQDVALRMALPLDAPRRDMLREFVRGAAAGTAADPAALLPRIEEIAARHDKYRPIAEARDLGIEAGVVTSAARGEFFVVAFTWPRT